MEKPYLLIAGSNYYPSAYTEDWVGCFETYEKAKAKVKVVTHQTLCKSGKNKGKIKSTREDYEVSGGDYPRSCDWYEIIDLREWAK
jgi:hypothetical protein